MLDLRGLVMAIYEETGEPNPHALAPKVLEAIPFGEEREILAMLLPDVCREVFRSLRGAPQKLPAPDTSVAASPRWRHVRRRWLDVPVKAGDTWKLLGDCTPEETLKLAADYGRRAEENAAFERRYRRLAEEAVARKVRVVGDLPEELVEEVMSS